MNNLFLYPLQFDKSPALRTVAENVIVFDSELEELIDDMHKMMHLYDGIGLAAPQLNISKRIIIFDFEPFIMVNPIIIQASGTQKLREGCLSFPQLFVDVQRSQNIQVTWQDITGNYQLGEFSGLNATVIQHEIDHLDGKVFIDHVSNMAVMLAKKKVKSKGPQR